MARTRKTVTAWLRLAALAGALGASSAWADPTSLELYGVLFDGSGNRINAPFVLASSTLYSSAGGSTVLAQFGSEQVHVGDGAFLQIFGVDDSLFAGDAYLQLTINGFTLGPRLGVFYNGSYWFASGVTAGGPTGSTLFQLYAGLDAPPPVPEPGTFALLAAGVAVLGLRGWRRRLSA